MNEELNYNKKKLDKTKTWLLFLFLGWSYGSMNQIGKQILFYLTFGGFGLWAIYVLFTLNKKIRKHNRHLALECGFGIEELAKYGLL